MNREDIHFIVQLIAKFISICSGSDLIVLTEILWMIKLFTIWVTRMLTSSHQLKRVGISKTLLTFFQADSKW